VNTVKQRKLKKWSKELVISELKAVEDLSAKINQRERPSLYGAAVRYFGSWKVAVERAGIDYDHSRKRRQKGHWNAEKVLEEVRKLENKSSGHVRANTPGLYSAALRIFGGWKQTIEAAGLDYQSIKKISGRRENVKIK
jgi:hypothetical protein